MKGGSTKKRIIMTDLTLEEYRTVPEDELKIFFREERQKMFCVHKTEVRYPGHNGDASPVESSRVGWIETCAKGVNRLFRKRKGSAAGPGHSIPAKAHDY